jgi:hypothetical protein
MADDKEAPPEHVAEFGKGGLPPPQADGRLDAPAFHRNHAPILAALRRLLAGRRGHVLEIGSGTVLRRSVVDARPVWFAPAA